MSPHLPTLPERFAASGLHIIRAGQTSIRQYQVLGERSSATNFTKRLLGRNTALTPVETLGWKHGFAQMLAVPPDLLVVCVVRNPESWARSMHAKPWHARPALQSLGFSDFIRAPWDSIVDHKRYFGGAAHLVGQPLQQDRDPLTGAPFANLLALRTAKLRALLSFLGRGANMVLLRAELVQQRPEQVLTVLRAGLQLPPQDGEFRPVHKRLGANFKPAAANRPATPSQITAADRDFIWNQLDTDLEAGLGYSPGGT